MRAPAKLLVRRGRSRCVCGGPWATSGSPIVSITAKGVKTADSEYELDILIFATGFDSFTGGFTCIDVRGVDGVSLKDKWDERGQVTYLSMMTAGFPNFFTMVSRLAGNYARTTEVAVNWATDTFEDPPRQRHHSNRCNVRGGRRVGRARAVVHQGQGEHRQAGVLVQRRQHSREDALPGVQQHPASLSSDSGVRRAQRLRRVRPQPGDNPDRCRTGGDLRHGGLGARAVRCARISAAAIRIPTQGREGWTTCSSPTSSL
jgi:hypothetical protein